MSMTKPNHESDVAFIEALADILNRNDLAELSVKREFGEHDQGDDQDDRNFQWADIRNHE